MKTMKIRLLATMITLAAVTTATIIPANAQRRSSERNTTVDRPQKSNTERKNTVEKKSTFKDYDKAQRSSSNRKVDSSRDIKRNNSPAVKSNKAEREKVTRTPVPNSNRSAARVDNSSRTVTKSSSGNNNNNRQRSTTKPQQNKSTVYSNSDNRSRNSARINNQTSSNDRLSTPNSRRSSEINARTTSRSSVNSKYNLNNNDKRYTPTREYKGSNKNWSNDYRGRNMNYNRNDRNFYRNYNHNKYSHWDRSWERYRWSQTSWRDYYYGYNPYSYKYYKHYYHHNIYGHVIRKFSFTPHVFIHNHNRYYSYNGHFFRYRRGIGYILVDMPFGFTFEYLPGNYERVYINGYLYFRVGNLFFEHTNYGFQLVHYPERYFAYDDGYSNNGYQYDDFY